PGRLKELGALFGYSVDEWDDQAFEDDEDEDSQVEGGKRRGEISRGAIKLKGALESGDQRKPYDPQVLVTENRRAGGGTPAARPEARIGEGLLEDLGFTTEQDAAPAAGDQPAAFQPAEPEPAPPPPAAVRVLPPTP